MCTVSQLRDERLLHFAVYGCHTIQARIVYICSITHTYFKCLTIGVVEYEEWRSFKTHAIDMYMNDMKEKHPHHRDRFSDQVWLFQNAGADDILRRLRERYTFREPQCYEICLRRRIQSFSSRVDGTFRL